MPEPRLLARHPQNAAGGPASYSCNGGTTGFGVAAPENPIQRYDRKPVGGAPGCWPRARRAIASPESRGFYTKMRGSPPPAKSGPGALSRSLRCGLSAANGLASAIWPARRERIAGTGAAAYDARMPTTNHSPPRRHRVESESTGECIEPSSNNMKPRRPQ